MDLKFLLCLICVFCSVCARTVCPESKKQYPGDCRLFYKCVLLPRPHALTHVWIPSRCSAGMVFDPSTKKCIIPPRSWDCIKNAEDADYVEIDAYGDLENETAETDPSQTEEANKQKLVQQMGHLSQLINSIKSVTNAVSYVVNNGKGNNPLFSLSLVGLNDTAANKMNKFESDRLENLPEQTTTQKNDEKPNAADKLILDFIQNFIFNSTKSDYNNSSRSNQNEAASVVSIGSKDKQYLTVQKYNSTILPLLNGTPVAKLPCINGVRLPNNTDCTRYYICNSLTAEVYSYLCPTNTAFHKQKRICDTEEYYRCTGQIEKLSSSDVTSKRNQANCKRPGKIRDPGSIRHYYICSRRNGKWSMHRMTCPGSLLFCSPKNICSPRKKCK